jgi:HTH-type transcriptional regulator/antitoxin HigA
MSSNLKYKVISNKRQYHEYCTILEDLLFQKSKDKNLKDEIELLTLLIEKWDDEHYTSSQLDPVQLLKTFIDDAQLKSKDLVEILGISKGYVSDILNYKKGLSKAVIRKLSIRFKVSQEAFNRPYKLIGSANSKFAEC